MIQFALHGQEYLDAAKHYHSVWETKAIKSDTLGKGKEVRLTLLLGTLTHS